ncbi:MULTISPECIES: DUF3823 domain-containing protein [unclassified Chitinophaga]|uniref:DUF3823 domain-containing protein n=1 Tax=unclassified Chitinophaga TaxID=2619133 RepID=UPI0009C5AA24|nr:MULTISPECIES: DUF3823 domain-containing protein [unclassified Chitinophaga]OMP78955.1 hypothetical protein BW716_12580 [[Flexibacter] sp. ATCC 35208]WPV64357.1 DUF3823 domain-containing protein [Chitinophaga sp. LS1]
MRYLLLTSLVLIFAAGCKKDNFEKPKSTLTGRVVYDKNAIGVRSNGVQVELWQHGYELFSKIPVYVGQDGAFSAILFDGDYKLVLRQGNGPWLDDADSLDVKVNGSASVDISVNPYFIISNATFTKSGTLLTATVSIQQINNNLPLESVNLYIGNTNIVDQVNNIKSTAVTPDISGPVTIQVTLPADAAYYARVGVKTAGVAEQVYSEVKKVE